MQKLAIIGSGDLAGQIAHHALATGKYIVVGFFDDFEEAGKQKFGKEVLGSCADILELYNQKKFDVLMMGIGYKHMPQRASLFEKLSTAIPFATVIHPSVIVDSNSKIGIGVMIYPGTVVDMNCVIEDNVLLYTGCVVSHDVAIGAHTILSPGVTTSGFVKIGKRVNLGTATAISDNIIINDDIKTGVGSVVVENLINPGLYYGVPAKQENK